MIILGGVGYFVWVNNKGVKKTEEREENHLITPLIGLWKLEKSFSWYPTTNELKEITLSPEEYYRYLEFRNDHTLCFGGELNAQRQPTACDKSKVGTFQIDGNLLFMHIADVTNNAKWEIDDEKLTLMTDVARPADEPPLKIKSVFAKIEIQKFPPSPQIKKNDKIPSDWQIYQNPEYEFSVRYPSGYVYTSDKESDEQHIAFGPKQGGSGFLMRVTITEKSYDAAMAGFRKESGGKFQEQPRSVNGINGIEFIGEPDAQLSIIAVAIPHKGRALVFTGLAQNRATLEYEVLPLFDLFISSFTVY